MKVPKTPGCKTIKSFGQKKFESLKFLLNASENWKVNDFFAIITSRSKSIKKYRIYDSWKIHNHKLQSLEAFFILCCY